MNLKIDYDKCVHCGLCAKDCIAGCIEFDENNFPKTAPGGEKRCIKCQHCLTICPTGALSILDKSPENSDPVWNDHNPDMVLNLIKSRRSFRQYKKENLSADIMNKLKNMLNWTPTGCNNHKLHFAFIDDIEVMDDFRDTVNKKLIKIITSKPLNKIAGPFARYKKAFLNGEDVIFRGAPHMVAVSVPVNAPCATIDPVIALSYFELYAQSLGVGTCWCGFGEACLQMFPDLCERLEIPQGYKAAYVMLFGPAGAKYLRTTQPESFEVVSVKKENKGEITFAKRIKRYFWNLR